MGFGSIASSLSFEAAADSSNVTFFLVHGDLSDEAKRSVLLNIRSCADDRFRFAPIVVLTRDGPFEDVLKNIDLGFDDVLVLPDNPELLQRRLFGQLTRDQIYFQTEDYLGPDRRRMELPDTPPDRRRIGVGGFTRLTIRRDGDSGARVVRREIIPAQTAAASHA